MCVYYAVTTLPLAEATILQYVHPIFTALLGVWIFNEIPSMWTYIGGGLIVTGALINVFGKQSVSISK